MIGIKSLLAIDEQKKLIEVLVYVCVEIRILNTQRKRL